MEFLSKALDWFLSTLSDKNADGSNSMDVTEYVDNTQPSIQYQNVAWEMGVLLALQITPRRHN